MTGAAWGWLAIPTLAIIAGAAVAAFRRPSPAVAAALQHFAAGVVFAAVAGEILPDLKHAWSPVPVFLGAALGIALMLLIRRLGERASGPAASMALVGTDILVDGLVLGIAFAAGARQGFILTVALTIEVLFLGLSVSTELAEKLSRGRVLLAATGLALLLPLGALLGGPVASLPRPALAGFFAFGLVALLYLVTEELLVEAHAGPETAWVTAMFFVGFLAMLALEEAAAPAG